MSSIKRVFAPAALALTAILCGCAGGAAHGVKPDLASSGFDKDARTPLGQYPIHVERHPEELALAVHQSGLSPNQQAALGAFAHGWREAGGDAPVIVSAPNGGAAGDPQFMVAATASALAGYGVPASLVRFDTYDAGGQPDAPVTARFERYVAEGPRDCADRWDNLLSTNSNNVSSHFGCSTSANLAAMVANPRDLIEPQAMTPADGLRRAAMLDKYRKGQLTSSERDAQASGAISQVVH